MSKRRWSTRLKAKLLRRSSTSSRNLNLTTTTTNTSASTSHDIPPIPSDGKAVAASTASREKEAEPRPAAPTTTTTTTTTPPISTLNQPGSHLPLSSASRPSLSSFVESHSQSQSRSLSHSQYTPDELASATGSPGGQYFLVPEYRRPTSSRSSAPREEQLVTQSSPAQAVQGEDSQSQEATPTQRPDQNRERAPSGSSRKTSPPPSELPGFPVPLPPRRADSSAALSLASIKADLPVTPLSPSKPEYRPSFPPPNNSPQRHASGSAEASALLHTVAEKPGNTYQSFPLPQASFSARPSLGSRRQSLLPTTHQHLVRSLLDTGSISEAEGLGRQQPLGSGMGLRKIWVKRPGGSATLLPTSEDALVDELRDQVVLKYANSLGRTLDAPDIIIRISMREGSNKLPTPDRILSPEEPLWTVLDSYYPGGQTVTEALVIEIPQRRTPKPSPRHNVYFTHSEPGEHGEYFPIMPSGNVNLSTPPHHAKPDSNNNHSAPSISILNTGQAPPVPSPGSRPRLRRPPFGRHSTHSPTLLGSASSKGVYLTYIQFCMLTL